MRFFLFITLVLAACTSLPPKVGNEVGTAYQQAFSLSEKGKDFDAIKAWDRFLKTYPTNPLSASAMYYKARSHENVHEYQSAINLYRSAITIWGIDNDKDRAAALLRIAASYEALGENAKGLATIAELERNPKGLEKHHKAIEIPARKALLYAKVGNQNEAKKYYMQATKGMNRYLKNPAGDQSRWLAEILYRLSETEPAQSLPDMNASLAALEINQSYLAKAIEMQVAPWDNHAELRLKQQYDSLLSYLQKYVTAKEVLERREQEEEQKEMLTQLFDLAVSFKHEFLPNSKVYEQKMENWMNSYKNKLQELLLKRKSGEGLTPAASEREGIRRKLPKTTESSNKDPNL